MTDSTYSVINIGLNLWRTRAAILDIEELASQMENSLGRVSGRDGLNLIQFNNLKSQVCALIVKGPFVMAPKSQGVSMLTSPSIGILGVDISSGVQYRSISVGIAKF